MMQKASQSLRSLQSLRLHNGLIYLNIYRQCRLNSPRRISAGLFFSFWCPCKFVVGRLYKILISCPLRHMDFLNVLGRLCTRTQPSNVRHRGSDWTFRDILVPKLLGTTQNIKKISYSYAMTAYQYFVQSAI